jgi:alpha-glucan,water dikinase
VGAHPGRALQAEVHKGRLLALLAGAGAAGQPPAAAAAHRAAPLPAAVAASVERLLQLPAAQLASLVRVTALPSKAVALLPPGSAAAAAGSGTAGALILRSDSNAEDLPGFAGAGLFESITTTPSEPQLADYAADPLVADVGARLQLAWRVGVACCVVEALLGGPQDVEGGVTADGRVFIVQARPQML